MAAATRKTTRAIGSTSTARARTPRPTSSTSWPTPGPTRREQSDRLSRRRAPRRRRDDGRRLRAEPEAFKQFAVGPLKPNRTNGDLLISLEYSDGDDNPIVTLYKITNVANFANGQTDDFPRSANQEGDRCGPFGDELRGAHDLGLWLSRPGLRLRRGIDRPQGAGHRDRLPRLQQRSHPQPDRRRPAELAAQGRGPEVPDRPQQLRQGHDRQGSEPGERDELRLHDHRWKEPVGLRPRG